MICDVLDVYRTCLMSVFETWWPLLPAAILISLTELWICDFYEDIEVTLLSFRNAMSYLIPMKWNMHSSSCCCLYEISNCIGSQYSNFHNLHELSIIPGDGAWYSKINKQLVHHE